MRQQKKPDKKERNYSIWFTGFVLILVYMILFDSMSTTTGKICKSILKERMLNVPETVLDVMKEKELQLVDGLEDSQDERGEIK